jgi:hypothetical protein
MRVSPRRLAGWEPTETTEYFYEGDRLIGSVTTREPEWDTSQVDLLLALHAFNADIGSHGHSLAKATSEAANPNNYESPLRYVGKGPFTDWAKKAELDKQDAYRAEFPKDAAPNMNGMYFTVEEVGG